jgi:hypothetical protein
MTEPNEKQVTISDDKKTPKRNCHKCGLEEHIREKQNKCNDCLKEIKNQRKATKAAKSSTSTTTSSESKTAISSSSSSSNGKSKKICKICNTQPKAAKQSCCNTCRNLREKVHFLFSFVFILRTHSLRFWLVCRTIQANVGVA